MIREHTRNLPEGAGLLSTLLRLDCPEKQPTSQEWVKMALKALIVGFTFPPVENAWRWRPDPLSFRGQDGPDAPQGRVLCEAGGLQHNGEPEEEPRDQEDTQAGSKATVPASPGAAGH